MNRADQLVEIAARTFYESTIGLGQGEEMPSWDTAPDVTKRDVRFRARAALEAVFALMRRDIEGEMADAGRSH